MLSLLLSRTLERKDFRKPSKPCHVGVHWIALIEYFQMSTHLPGFQSFFRVFASFCIGQISHQQHKGLESCSYNSSHQSGPCIRAILMFQRNYLGSLCSCYKPFLGTGYFTVHHNTIGHWHRFASILFL